MQTKAGNSAPVHAVLKVPEGSLPGPIPLRAFGRLALQLILAGLAVILASSFQPLGLQASSSVRGILEGSALDPSTDAHPEKWLEWMRTPEDTERRPAYCPVKPPGTWAEPPGSQLLPGPSLPGLGEDEPDAAVRRQRLKENTRNREACLLQSEASTASCREKAETSISTPDPQWTQTPSICDVQGG